MSKELEKEKQALSVELQNLKKELESAKASAKTLQANLDKELVRRGQLLEEQKQSFELELTKLKAKRGELKNFVSKMCGSVQCSEEL